MNDLQGIARFRFQEGKLEEFKHLSAQCMEIVRNKDTGTLQYDPMGNVSRSSTVIGRMGATVSLSGPSSVRSTLVQCEVSSSISIIVNRKTL